MRRPLQLTRSTARDVESGMLDPHIGQLTESEKIDLAVVALHLIIDRGDADASAVVRLALQCYPSLLERSMSMIRGAGDNPSAPAGAPPLNWEEWARTAVQHMRSSVACPQARPLGCEPLDAALAGLAASPDAVNKLAVDPPRSTLETCPAHFTPLIRAVVRGHLEVVRCLLELKVRDFTLEHDPCQSMMQHEVGEQNRRRTSARSWPCPTSPRTLSGSQHARC